LRGAKFRNDLVIVEYCKVCGSGLVACTLSVNPTLLTNVKPEAEAWETYWKQAKPAPPMRVDSSV
jgi:hypothetical protein